MDRLAFLTTLKSERAQLDAVIVALETLLSTGNGAAPPVRTHEPAPAPRRAKQGKRPKAGKLPKRMKGPIAKPDYAAAAAQVIRGASPATVVQEHRGMKYANLMYYVKKARAAKPDPNATPSAPVTAGGKKAWV